MTHQTEESPVNLATPKPNARRLNNSLLVIGGAVCGALGLLLLWSCSVAMAMDIFDEPCRRYGVPKALVLAIAQTESSLSPWVVNIAGKDFHPRSREEALRLIHAARARKLSHDIGLMQINNWWLDKLGISPETALAPENNVMLGVWILAGEIRRHGYNWKAVGAYHSPTPARQVFYAHAVHKRYAKLR